MSMNGRLDNGQLEAEAKAIRRLKAEWKIQNECIADQHDEISELKSVNAELLESAVKMTKRRNAEIERLESINAGLLEVVENALFCNLNVPLPKHIIEAMRAAIANAQPQGE